MSFKMVDLLEMPEKIETTASSPEYAQQPCYPYGLCLRLDEKTMAKVGIDELPEVGEMIHIMAIAKVISVGSSATENHDSKHMELQITHMALEDEDKEYSYSKTMYGSDNDEDE